MMGPIVNASQRDRIEAMVQQAVMDGGRLVLGGRRPAQFSRGFWYELTLLADLDNCMTIARDEVFKPVLVAIPYDSDDDAVRIANDSLFGLSGAVVGADRDRAVNFARRIRTRTASVNGGLWYGTDAPFGGYKQSGIGREMGVAGFEEYLEQKSFAEPAASVLRRTHRSRIRRPDLVGNANSRCEPARPELCTCIRRALHLSGRAMARIIA